MKKLICLAVLITIAVSAYSLPSWYSEQVLDCKQIINRENGEFVDTTYMACASVNVGEEIKSLDEARDKAIEEAFLKIKEVIDFSVEGEKKLLHCFYDDALESTAYVQVSFTISDIYVEEPVVTKTPIELLRDYSGAFDVPLKLEDAKLSITAMVKTSLLDKDGLFCLELSNETKNILKSKESVIFKYSNGVPVKDDVAKYSDGELKFTHKTFIKRLRTLVIIRVDTNSECDEVSLVYKDIEVKETIQHTDDNRWKNLVFDFDKGLINEYNPEFVLRTNGKSVSLGSLFVYQEL